MKLIDVWHWIGRAAADRLARLKRAGIENIALARAGEAERGKKPLPDPGADVLRGTQTQNDGNYIIRWRDFDGDFDGTCCVS